MDINLKVTNNYTIRECKVCKMKCDFNQLKLQDNHISDIDGQGNYLMSWLYCKNCGAMYYF